MWLPTSAGRIGRGQGQAPVVRHNGRNSASPSPTGWRRCDDRCSFGRGRRSRPESRARGLGGVVSDCSCPEDGFGRHYSFIASPPIRCRWSRALALPCGESSVPSATKPTPDHGPGDRPLEIWLPCPFALLRFDETRKRGKPVGQANCLLASDALLRI